MLQLGTSICSLELPVHTLLTVVSLVMPRRKFLVKFSTLFMRLFTRHWFPRAESSTSAMSSQLSCLGVWCISRRFATASRHPARGSVKRKMLQVPFLTYSLSSYRTPVLLEVKPSLASARSWTGFSSIHTTGCLASYGRLYTSRTSSIAATKATLRLAGIHQHFFR